MFAVIAFMLPSRPFFQSSLSDPISVSLASEPCPFQFIVNKPPSSVLFPIASSTGFSVFKSAISMASLPANFLSSRTTGGIEHASDAIRRILIPKIFGLRSGDSELDRCRLFGEIFFVRKQAHRTAARDLIGSALDGKVVDINEVTVFLEVSGNGV